MAYKCELGTGQKIYLDNQGNQTVITSIFSSPGQQQQSSSSFSTGKWTSIPEVFHTSQGIFVKINSIEGEYYVQVQGSSLSVMSGTPYLNNCQQMQMQQVDSIPTSPMPPMKPMKPMQMGNMKMNMNPMEMRMGNMKMNMGSASVSTSTSSHHNRKSFCPQCGTAINQSDRFCSSCGYNLIN
jgi:hypothetical protein